MEHPSYEEINVKTSKTPLKVIKSSDRKQCGAALGLKAGELGKLPSPMDFSWPEDYHRI